MTEGKELPQVEEPTEEKAGEIDVEGLMAQLEKAGVTNVEDLDGKLRAGSEAGNLARLLGDERKRSQELADRLAQQPKPQPQTDYMDTDYGQTINIEDAIEKSVSKVFTKREEAQRKAQEAQLQAYNKVTGHPSYKSGFVKDEFDAKLKDPNYVYQVQMGLIDPVSDFYDTIIKKQQILMQESHKTIEQLAGGKKIDPPHVETGERTGTNLVSETPSETQEQKRMRELKEKTDKGYLPTEEETLSVIDSVFGMVESPQK